MYDHAELIGSHKCNKLWDIILCIICNKYGRTTQRFDRSRSASLVASYPGPFQEKELEEKGPGYEATSIATTYPGIDHLWEF